MPSANPMELDINQLTMEEYLLHTLKFPTPKPSEIHPTSVEEITPRPLTKEEFYDDSDSDEDDDKEWEELTAWLTGKTNVVPADTKSADLHEEVEKHEDLMVIGEVSNKDRNPVDELFQHYLYGEDDRDSVVKFMRLYDKLTTEQKEEYQKRTQADREMKARYKDDEEIEEDKTKIEDEKNPVDEMFQQYLYGDDTEESILKSAEIYEKCTKAQKAEYRERVRLDREMLARYNEDNGSEESNTDFEDDSNGSTKSGFEIYGTLEEFLDLDPPKKTIPMQDLIKEITKEDKVADGAEKEINESGTNFTKIEPPGFEIYGREKEHDLGSWGSDHGENKNGILENLPPKLGDGGSIWVPCTFDDLKIESLVDTGASINVMTHDLYNKLKLPPLEDCNMVISLGDTTQAKPVGMISDVLVTIGEFVYPTDFIIMNVKDPNPEFSVVLGRPFLRTSGALIDMRENEIMIRDGFKSMTYNSTAQYIVRNVKFLREFLAYVYTFDDMEVKMKMTKSNKEGEPLLGE